KVNAAIVRQIVDDLRPDRAQVEVFERLEEASLNDISGRGMSQETRDLFHAVRDYLVAAARELAERESVEVTNQQAFHTAEHEGLNNSRKAEYKQAVKQLEKRAGLDPADRLEELELPALSAMLGKKSDGDVDAAGMELMRLA